MICYTMINKHYSMILNPLDKHYTMIHWTANKIRSIADGTWIDDRVVWGWFR